MRLLLGIALAFLLAPWGRALVAPESTLATDWPSGGPRTENETILNTSGERVRHGRYRSWYEGGSLACEGAYRHGAREGLWRWWHETGEPQGACRYEHDVGVYIGWRRDGSLQQQGPQRGEMREGNWTEYYPSGRVHLVGAYREDRQHGLWTFHTDEDPPQTITTYFQDGRQIR